MILRIVTTCRGSILPKTHYRAINFTSFLSRADTSLPTSRLSFAEVKKNDWEAKALYIMLKRKRIILTGCCLIEKRTKSFPWSQHECVSFIPSIPSYRRYYTNHILIHGCVHLGWIGKTFEMTVMGKAETGPSLKSFPRLCSNSRCHDRIERRWNVVAYLVCKSWQPYSRWLGRKMVQVYLGGSGSQEFGNRNSSFLTAFSVWLSSVSTGVILTIT